MVISIERTNSANQLDNPCLNTSTLTESYSSLNRESSSELRSELSLFDAAGCMDHDKTDHCKNQKSRSQNAK